MTRYDGVWARVDVAILHDPRLMDLPATGFRFYMTAYLIAFQERSETLPAHYSCKNLAFLSRLHQKTAAKMLQKCIDAGLLTETTEGRIRVIGIAQNAHGNFQFRDSERGGFPDNSRLIPAQTDRKKDKDGDDRQAPPAPPAPSAFE